MQSKFKKRFLGVCASSLFLFLIGAILLILSPKKSDIIAPLKLQRTHSYHAASPLPFAGTKEKLDKVVAYPDSVLSKEYEKDQSELRQNDVLAKSVISKNHVSSSQAWVLSAGSFSNKKNADKLLRYLKQSRYNAYIVKKTSDHTRGVFYRVMIGPELDKHVLKIIKESLQKKRIKTKFLMQQVQI